MFLSFLAWHIPQMLLPKVEEVSVLPELDELVFDLRGGQVEGQRLV